jgi:hypothetical protein
MYANKDLRAELEEVVADHAKLPGTSIDAIVEELDHVRAITPEIARRSRAGEAADAAVAAAEEEHPARRLERLFRLGCAHGLRQTRAMDIAARQMAIWDGHPSEDAPDLLDQLTRCGDAIERALERPAS